MPLPPVEPILPSKTLGLFVIKNPSRYVFELKLDGFRCLAYIEDGKVELRTKVGKTHQGFRNIKQELKKLGVQNAILDGEIVCMDEKGYPDFNALMHRMQALLYGCFDLLYLNGRDLRELPLMKRKQMLQDLLGGRNSFVFPVVAFPPEQANEFINMVRTNDLEGLVAKLRDAPYDPAIPDNWIKLVNPGYTQYKDRWKWFRNRK